MDVVNIISVMFGIFGTAFGVYEWSQANARIEYLVRSQYVEST